MAKGGYLANLAEVVQQMKEELSLLPDTTDPEQLEAALAEYEVAHEVRRLKFEEQREAQAEAELLVSPGTDCPPPEAAGVELVVEAEEAKHETIVVESLAGVFEVKPLAPQKQLMTVNKLEAISPMLVESQTGLIEAKLTTLEPVLMANKPEAISPIIAESHAELIEAMLYAPQTHSMTVNKLEPISPVVQAPEVETEEAQEI
jgi:hypothetical protein